MSLSSNDNDWRSPCPVARILDILGDKWSMLVIRDLMLGKTRFKEFISSPERIPTNILTDRLNRFLIHGIVEKVPISEGGKRFAYQLTKKGNALRPILKAMVNWGLKYEEGTRIGIKTQK